MTAQQEAIELREAMFKKCNVTIAGTHTIFRQLSVGLALIAIEGMLKICQEIYDTESYTNTYGKQVNFSGDDRIYFQGYIDHYQGVKEELLKLQNT